MADVPFWATFVSGGIGAVAALGGTIITQIATGKREKNTAASRRQNELTDEVRDRSMRAAEQAFEGTLELLDKWRSEPTDSEGRFEDLHEPILRRISTRAAIISVKEVRHGVYFGVEAIEGVSARYTMGDIDKESPAQECRWIAGHVRDVLGAYLRGDSTSYINHHRQLTRYRERAAVAVSATNQE